jgi:hypothetical protein
MRVIPKCRRQGSGSLSPQDPARALALSQSYRFVNNSHDLPFTAAGRKFSPDNFPDFYIVGKARNPLADGNRPAGASKECILALEQAQGRVLYGASTLEASWLNLEQLPEPGCLELSSPKHRELTFTSRR